jgi:hypothetical protein
MFNIFSKSKWWRNNTQRKISSRKQFPFFGSAFGYKLI